MIDSIKEIVTWQTLCSDSTPVVGDTITYTVKASWKMSDLPGVLPLVPQNGIYVKGLSQVALRQVSARETVGNEVFSHNEFVYTLAVSDTGAFTIPALRFDAVLPSANAEVKSTEFYSEPFSFYVKSPLNVLPVVAGMIPAAALLIAFIWRHRRRMSKLQAKRHAAAEREKLIEEMLVLKTRVSTAESRSWLHELEHLMIRFAELAFGAKDWKKLSEESFWEKQVFAVGKKNFKTENVGNNENNMGEMSAEKIAESWKTLEKLFNEARYGGGNQKVFENQETWKTAYSLMRVAGFSKDI